VIVDGSTLVAPKTLVHEGRRSWRDTLLGMAAAILGGGVFLFLIQDILRLIDSLESDTLVGIKISSGFQLLSPLVGIPAFVVLSWGFFSAPERRARRFGIAASLLAVAFLASFISDTLLASVFGTHDAAQRATAAFAAQATADLALAVAALLAAAAFLSSSPRTVSSFPRREGILGWASVGVGAAFALMMAGTILILTFYSDLGATGGYTSGIGVVSAGDGVAIAASIVTALAFFLSRWRSLQGQLNHWSRRDGLLGIAFSALFLAFLLTAIGEVIVAAADPANGVKGKAVAADWLGAVGDFGLAAATACAAAGFFASFKSQATVESR
jgi:hypothetical protein